MESWDALIGAISKTRLSLELQCQLLVVRITSRHLLYSHDCKTCIFTRWRGLVNSEIAHSWGIFRIENHLQEEMILLEWIFPIFLSKMEIRCFSRMNTIIVVIVINKKCTWKIKTSKMKIRCFLPINIKFIVVVVYIKSKRPPLSKVWYVACYIIDICPVFIFLFFFPVLYFSSRIRVMKFFFISSSSVFRLRSSVFLLYQSGKKCLP